MELQLKIIGVLLIMLALVHIVFPKYFNWKEECSTMSLINRQMMYVHTFFIALVVFLMGVLCFTSAKELLATSLGKKLCLGFAIFWCTRLYIQFFGYSKLLWHGKTFETTIHILFTILWGYLTIIFFSVFWM